ncbi:sulfatase-like hydrolase/transferase [Rubinisphaera margarita]|uniref:sulfatase-like hydrolase/transferase n=1 Tax=Rubinisphaera margarita TaxID=2909586 RepID=UPI001EE8E8A6|nr:sulfatase-like hydrolase/transferase [Rubinisphaera margarita]MCG6158173.1 sulfatase-like hydrolase/transferase [Rubinisphaera margarita]
MSRMLAFVAAVLFLVGSDLFAKTDRPNIIFILADDLGWSELGCYGNEFNETPHLDRLASDGMRFSQAYASAPVCSPYRAALLTGQYPARLGIIDYLRPNSANALSTDHVTLPEVLQRHGYQTGMIGKWHLTGYEHHGAEFEVKPRAHGFDWDMAREVKGVGNGANFWPYVFRDQSLRWLDLPENRLGEHEFLVDRMNLEAVDFIERNSQRPFFLYLSHYATHSILNGKPELVEKYRRKSPPGKSTREQCYLCRDQGLSGDALNHWAGDHNPHLAAMLESIDDGIGKIRGKLAELGLDDNTIVIFTSDNGGETNVTSNAPLSGGKSQLYEGGIRVPLIVFWPGGTPAGSLCSLPTSNVDFYPTLLEVIDIGADPSQILDGESLLASWKDPDVGADRESLFWHYPLDEPHFLGGRSSGAIRHGDWKLIEFFDSGIIELYSLATDPSEQNDVASKHPEIAAELKTRLAEWRESINARMPSPPLLVKPKELVFADHFSTGQVRSNWFFNGDWEATEGRLQRGSTGSETTRIFAKNLQYGDGMVRFDFQFQEAEDIRFISGSEGSYNSIIRIQPDHFRIETGQDKSGPYFQHWHGECAYDFAPDRWYTMTIEFIGDQIVAHVDPTHVAYARHPVIEKTRDYFAFQVDDSRAAFDNVQLLTVGKHPRFVDNLRRIESLVDQHPVQRSLEEQLRIASTNAHDRLYQTDSEYRILVQRVHDLDEQNKVSFPTVFRSHKEIRQEIADRRRTLLEEDPQYKKLLFATYAATRALEAFLIEQEPQIAVLPDSRRKRELERVRIRFLNDARYVGLVEQQRLTQEQLENAYPELFVTDEEINATRQQQRTAISQDPAFRKAIDDRAAAWRDQQDYLMSHDEHVVEVQRRMQLHADEPGKP